MGIELSVPMQEFVKRGMADECVTTRIDVAGFVDLKLDALSCHASQLDPKQIWQRLPPEIRREGLKVETLVRRESRDRANTGGRNGRVRRDRDSGCKM